MTSRSLLALCSLVSAELACTTLTGLVDDPYLGQEGGAGGVANGGGAVGGGGASGGTGGGAGEGSGGIPNGPVETLVTGQTSPRGIALDDTKVYWTDDVANTIRRASKEGGGGIDALAADQYGPFDIHVDSTHVYWNNVVNPPNCVDRVSRVEKTVGAMVERVYGACGSHNSARIVGDGVSIYGSFLQGIGGVVRMPKVGDTNVALVPDGPAYGAIAADGVFVYVADNTSILRIESEAVPPDTVVAGQGDPQDLEVDGEHLYWLNANGSVLRLVKDDLGGTPEVLASQQGGATRLALDEQNVYWVALTEGAVRAMPKAGGDVVDVATDQPEPFDVAVDEGGVYWTNRGDGTIRRVTR